jgi:hypothetical protein
VSIIIKSGSTSDTADVTADRALKVTTPAATLAATAVSTVGNPATLTLPAAGTGLYHFITRISIVRFNGLAGTAAATPWTVTTTNLPGGYAIAITGAGGNVGDIYENVINVTAPLRSSATNTATTITTPTATALLWRVTAFYYTATA